MICLVPIFFRFLLVHGRKIPPFGRNSKAMVLEGTLPWFSSIVDFLGVGLLDFNQLISRVDEFTILIALMLEDIDVVGPGEKERTLSKHDPLLPAFFLIFFLSFWFAQFFLLEFNHGLM